MSVFQTLKQHKVYVTNTIANALRKNPLDKEFPRLGKMKMLLNGYDSGVQGSVSFMLPVR